MQDRAEAMRANTPYDDLVLVEISSLHTVLPTDLPDVLEGQSVSPNCWRFTILALSSCFTIVSPFAWFVFAFADTDNRLGESVF